MLGYAEEVLFEELTGPVGHLGVITLNRPKALNALNLGMCAAIDEKLVEWEKKEEIKAVVIRGEGERAFCAGGDLRTVYEYGRSGRKKSAQFFAQEYKTDRHLYHFSKPYISLMHGITMGGGLGLTVHGSHRVASEDFICAMPETSIGFFPDVGASYFLPRSTGKMGIYLALTSDRLNVGDAIYTGMVDHVVPKKNFDPLILALLATRFNKDVNVQLHELISGFSIDIDNQDEQKPRLLPYRNEINHCFGRDTIEKIIYELEELKTEWARETLYKLSTKSPTSLKVAMRQFQFGIQQDFDECIQMEYRIVNRFLEQRDFYEGIRATIIHKDLKPRWHPDNLEKVTDEYVASFFAPLQNKKIAALAEQL